jgi:hypothetical protein
MLLLPHQHYSPDLAPADFFLFQKIKMQPNGRRFHTAAKIQCESQNEMDSHKMTLRPDSSSGRNAVTSALLCKVTISKEMVFKLK